MDNKNYSILIVCIYGIPSHIDRFIRNLKKTNPSVSITLFSNKSKKWFSEEMLDCLDAFIQKKNKYSGWANRLSWLGNIIDHYACVRQLNELSKTHHYDIVNIHFPQYFMCHVMRAFRKMSSSIIVSPWGSDVLRLERKGKRRKLAQVFRKADYVTAGKTGNIGGTLINEMGIDEDKFCPLGWGSETIDYINEHVSEVSTERAKELLNLEGKYLITCGYNAFEEQRHEIIIDAIENKRKDLPANLLLLFPVTYGSAFGNKKQVYVERLKKRCSELDVPAMFYENYLSVSDLFLLRRATDMFIHIQPTDAGNSSLQEYVLCGKKVVHGSWVHYDNLEKYQPLFYYPVNEIDELGNVIVNAYNSDPIIVPEQVMDKIRDRGWKAKMKLWDDFFISCVRN